MVVEQQFDLLLATVKEARRQEVQVLKGEKKAALQQAESIQAHLEQRRAELIRILTEMNKLSRRESDVDFLQVQIGQQHGITVPGATIQPPAVDGPNKKSSASVKTIHLILRLVSPQCLMCCQECTEWKKGAADVSLPTVCINNMDHLASYVEVVVDATQELRDLVLSSYREKTSLTRKHEESRSCHPTSILIGKRWLRDQRGVVGLSH